MSVPQLIFILLTIITLGGGLGVVTSGSVFISALFLILSFVGVAGLYVLLNAGFLAAVQLLIYVGAIAVLILFVVMLTHRVMTEGTPQTNGQWGIAAFLGVLLFLALSALALRVDWPISGGPPPSDAVRALGQQLLSVQTGFVLPFEVASVVLLVALVGAIIIARE